MVAENFNGRSRQVASRKDMDYEGPAVNTLSRRNEEGILILDENENYRFSVLTLKYWTGHNLYPPAYSGVR